MRDLPLVGEYADALLPSLQTLSIDVVVVAVLFVGALLFTAHQGREGTAAFILSLYVALLLQSLFPYSQLIAGLVPSAWGQFAVEAIQFAVLTLVIYWAVADIIHRFYASGRWLDSILLSGAATALLLVVIYHILPIETVYTPEVSLQALFAAPQVLFWWLVAPIVVFIVLAKR